ncbi:bifunctional copper resistance protein CopD/cytochrome c oxidase assembly protein [Nonomuraea sp. MCN248]|uniref:Bifunctional copper resistance protein CopD/cytochrome c oxidase assembly protein n=1 Tax=Nonomuraea corallina TaxID=2989783 RepID=A0ABT4SEV8_9ACTN|nr:bifunctional copper resistance protein CopD/cytochrome c oxidase assembly protein [Nonomuraea corallina]MDA0635510.1 bifunctional copper resistance protein CopD/cytochrome c oxidase assembly protein [Nonomuraea corallina]
MTRAARLALAAAGAAVAALVIAMIVGGAAFPRIILGVPSSGVVTRWGLPISKLAMDVAGVATVGLLLAAALLLPSDKGVLGRTAQSYVRAASWAGLAWAAAAFLTMVFSVSDVWARPVPQILNRSFLVGYATQESPGIALTLVVLFGLSIALFSRGVITVGATAGLLLLALVTLTPPALTGHSASSPNHGLAVTSVTLHLLTLALWVGGLAVLALHAALKQPQLDVVAGRFSRMAVWIYAGVGLSGVFSVLARLTSLSDLWTSSYGVLVVAKIVAFVLLGYIGWWHRQRTLVDLDAGRPRAFARLAGGELLLMLATIGLAVALARTPPPPVTLPADRAFDLLGYPVPPPISLSNIFTLWWFDLFFALLAAVLAGLYGAGVVRLLRRGDAWPWGRTASWYAGVVILTFATQSGVARYAKVMFDVHMIEHMTLAMIVPIFLVLGAPITLALRALKPATRRGDRGPREWLTAILHSGYVRVISHPGIATAIFIASTYALYFTPLFEAAMEEHLGHLFMIVHFLVSGCLFFWVVIGVDPGPHRLPYVGRLLLLFVTMPFHAFFGIALMMTGTLIAPGWYEQLGRTWGGPLLQEQQNGGAIAWGFGEIPTLIVLLAIAVQWYRSEDRKARRDDRSAARSGDPELSSYNDYLARLNQLDKRE